MMETVVLPHHNNRFVTQSKRYHPHVYEHGNVCLGSANVKTPLVMGNIAGAFELLAVVLSNYNDGSPVTQIHHFKDAAIFNPSVPRRSVRPFQKGDQVKCINASDPYTLSCGIVLGQKFKVGEARLDPKSYPAHEELFEWIADGGTKWLRGSHFEVV
jgi:hypothetical protein